MTDPIQHSRLEYKTLLQEGFSKLFTGFPQKYDNEIFKTHFGETPQQCVNERLGSCSRSFIYLTLCDILSKGSYEVPVEVPVGIELLHQATLVIDDMQDGAEYRKGNKTAGAEHNLHRVYDYGLMLSYYAMDSICTALNMSKDVGMAIPQTGLNLLKGQTEDLNANWGRSFEDYKKTAALKTGSLYVLPAQLACYSVGGIDASFVDLMSELMNEIGICHQITDDIHDASSYEVNQSVFTEADRITQNIRQSIFSVDYIPENNAPHITEERIQNARNLLRQEFSEVERINEALRENLDERIRDILKWDSDFFRFLKKLAFADNKL